MLDPVDAAPLRLDAHRAGARHGQRELKSIAKTGVAQYVLLVTDGGETCKGDVTLVAQQLAAAGIKTFVVGFGGPTRAPLA